MADGAPHVIAAVGPGRVGSSLGRRWAGLGHDIVYGVRDPSDPKYRPLTDHAEVTTIPEAASRAAVILLAVPWPAAEEVAGALGPLGDRVVMDATNPLAGQARRQDYLEACGAEQLAGWLDGGRVVKAFNTTGSGNMADATYPEGTPMMPIAGDDDEARKIVADLVAEIGFDPVFAGGLAAARGLEHLAVLWIRLAYTLGNGPDIAFALLRR